MAKNRFRLDGRVGRDPRLPRAENWRSWDCAINDAAGNEVDRITKWAGILREGFTTADRYLLHIPGKRVASDAATDGGVGRDVDVALKQDDTGGVRFGGLDFDI